MKKVTSVILILLMLFSFCGCNEQPEETEAQGTAVQVSTIECADISSLSRVSGKLVSSSETSVYVQASYKCTSVKCSTGSMVKKGDVLAKVDLSTMTNSNDNAAIDQLIILNKQVDMAKSAWDAARALYNIGASSRVEVDSAEIQYLSAKAQRDQALLQLDTSIMGTQAAGAISEENIDSEGNILAPMDGKVVALTAESGSYISPSYAVAVISGDEQMKVSLYVSESLVTRISAGDAVSVKLSSAGTVCEGKIASIDKTSNMQTGLYPVLVEIPETEGLFAGMSADVEFTTESAEAAVVVPTQAILNSNGTEYVFVVEGDTAKYAEIETGLSGNGLTEVVSGLSEGQLLVVVGQSYLKDGSSVRIVE